MFRFTMVDVDTVLIIYLLAIVIFSVLSTCLRRNSNDDVDKMVNSNIEIVPITKKQFEKMRKSSRFSEAEEPIGSSNQIIV